MDAGCRERVYRAQTVLVQPPVLVVRQPVEELFLYIAATPYSVSTVIVVERDKVQHPIYYVSEVIMETASLLLGPQSHGHLFFPPMRGGQEQRCCRTHCQVGHQA